MKTLTAKYRKRLTVIWTVQALTIAWNLWRASFAAMAFPMTACWLYVMACLAREGMSVQGFLSQFRLRYPARHREWEERSWNPATRYDIKGPCPVAGDADLGERWEEFCSAQRFAGRVFAGFVALFFALLLRMMIFGPYT